MPTSMSLLIAMSLLIRKDTTQTAVLRLSECI